MANHTNYSLRQVDDDTYADGTWTLALGNLLSGVLYNHLASIVNGGVLSGWDILADKTVSAGEGVVNGTVPKTTTAQAITGLTNSAKNYVYATTDTGSASDTRSVDFVAQLSATAPANTVRLGSITLDGSGVKTDFSNDDPLFLRDRLFPSRRRTFTFTETYSVPVGTEKVFSIDHADEITFTGATWFRITDQDPGVYCRCQDTGGGTFDLFVFNNYQAGYDYDYDSGYDAALVSITVERTGEI